MWKIYIFHILYLISEKCDSELITTYYKELYVGKYSDVGNIQLLDTYVPPSCLATTWHIHAKKKRSSCENFPIETYLRYGGIPVAQFDGNNTFSDEYSIKENESTYLQITSYSNVNVQRVSNPLYGTWFLAAYIARKDNQIIQSIDSYGCSYSIQVNVSVLLETDVKTVSANAQTTIDLFNHSSTIIKYYVESYTLKINLNLTCLSKSCDDISIFGRSQALPFLNDSSYTNCSFPNDCRAVFENPVNDVWFYILIHPVTNTTDSKLSVLITYESFKKKTSPPTPAYTPTSTPTSTPHLPSPTLISQIWENQTTHLPSQPAGENPTPNLLASQPAGENPTTSLLAPQSAGENPSSVVNVSYPTLIRMQRMMSPDETLSTVFSSGIYSTDSVVLLFDVNMLLFEFRLDAVRDVGSTLRLLADVSFSAGNVSMATQYIIVCMQPNHMPLNLETQEACNNVQETSVLNRSAKSYSVKVPFPVAGNWYIGVQYVCKDSSAKRVKCDQNVVLKLRVQTMECDEGMCLNGGSCREYSKSVYVMAACTCVAGYRGFNCADNTYASSDAIQLLNTLLLCLSNLFFLPAIAASLIRRRYVECLAYSANMFFSTFYHACDMSSWSKYKYCLMPYYVLSFSDFFCSLLSFWVTLIAMARLPAEPRSVLHMFGAILLAMAIRWNVNGLITNILPIAVGAAITITAWIVRCCKKRKLYPSKADYLWMLPGILLAILGMCIFGFVENDSNYPYTHSAWHVCMSLSILFLLPRDKLIYKDEKGTDSLNIQLNEYSDQNSLVYHNFTEDNIVLT